MDWQPSLKTGRRHRASVAKDGPTPRQLRPDLISARWAPGLQVSHDNMLVLPAPAPNSAAYGGETHRQADACVSQTRTCFVASGLESIPTSSEFAARGSPSVLQPHPSRFAMPMGLMSVRIQTRGSYFAAACALSVPLEPSSSPWPRWWSSHAERESCNLPGCEHAWGATLQMTRVRGGRAAYRPDPPRQTQGAGGTGWDCCSTSALGVSGFSRASVRDFGRRRGASGVVRSTGTAQLARPSACPPARQTARPTARPTD